MGLQTRPAAVGQAKDSTSLLGLLSLQCRLVLFTRLVFAELKHAGVALIPLGRRFLCLFVNSLPLETCLRVWDLFFFEQCASSLFRVALALVDIYAQVRTFLLGVRDVCLRAHIQASLTQEEWGHRRCWQLSTALTLSPCFRIWHPCPLTARD